MPALMRVAKQKTLSILEQARFVVELLSMHDMSIADVAETLSRSKAWVSMRRGLLTEMSQAVQEILFRGAFPVYSYMVTLRPFMRMNGVGQQEIERFVQAVAGQQAERAGDRTVGPWLLPRASLAARSDRPGELEMVAPADANGPRGPRRLQRLRTRACCESWSDC